MRLTLGIFLYGFLALCFTHENHSKGGENWKEPNKQPFDPGSLSWVNHIVLVNPGKLRRFWAWKEKSSVTEKLINLGVDWRAVTCQDKLAFPREVFSLAASIQGSGIGSTLDGWLLCALANPPNSLPLPHLSVRVSSSPWMSLSAPNSMYVCDACSLPGRLLICLELRRSSSQRPSPPQLQLHPPSRCCSPLHTPCD